MPWDKQQAKQRVAAHDFMEFEVNVADLSREMDFHRLGTKDVRRACGAHLYADVSNFHQAVADAGGDTQKLKKLVRAASVLRRVQADLLEHDEIGALQLQAVRLHSLIYKPYDNEAERAKRASFWLSACIPISTRSSMKYSERYATSKGPWALRREKA